MYEHAMADTTVGKNLPLMLRSRAELIPDVTLQAAKDKDGKFVTYSYKDVYTRVVGMACAMKVFGIKRGDRIGIMADNRREWLVTDMALLSIGAIDVPRGCDSTGTEMRFILDFSGCRLSFFESGHQLEKVLEKRSDVPDLQYAVLFDPPDDHVKESAAIKGIELYLFSEFEKTAAQATEKQRAEIEAEMDRTKPDDVATIIFTSGTTGIPKGVMLTHDNIIAQMEVVHDVLPVRQGDMWLSILPVWHSFERAVQYYIIALKSGVAYSKPVAQVMQADMAVIHPQWICGVPRMWEAFARGIYKAMRKKGGAVFALFSASLSVGRAYYWAKERVYGLRCRFRDTSRRGDMLAGMVPFVLLSPVYKLFDLLVYRRIREQFGGRLTAGISGGGSLPPEIDAFYHSAGITLLEGYGVTETAPVLSVRSCLKPRSGCVGEVYPSVEIKIVPEENGAIMSTVPLPPGSLGIIMARGRQIMKGYYKSEKLTDTVIDKNGWFNTGDIGMLSFDNEVKILGRAKDTIVLIDGENVEPLPVEQAVGGSEYVETVVVVGQDRKYLGALIVPVKDTVIAWAAENEITYGSYEDLLKTRIILALFHREIANRVNERTGFRPCERISKFILLPESFRQGREINGKLEVMRFRVTKLYEKEIESLFN